jgi:hypothetical protein
VVMAGRRAKAGKGGRKEIAEANRQQKKAYLCACPYRVPNKF